MVARRWSCLSILLIIGISLSLILPSWALLDSEQNVKIYIESMKKGQDDLDNKKYKDAEGHFLKALEVDPHQPQPRHQLGLCYTNLGEEDKAIEQWLMVIERFPNYVLAYYDLGVSYFDSGYNEKAIEHFKKAIEVHPNSWHPEDKTVLVDSYVYLSSIYLTQEDFHKSLLYANKAIELDPKNGGAYNNAALSYCGLGNEAQSLASMIKAANAGYTNELWKLMLDQGCKE